MLLKCYTNVIVPLQIAFVCVTPCFFYRITTLIARPVHNLVGYCTQNCQGLNYACLLGLQSVFFF